MYVMGVNSVYHESAACLLQDGALVAAAEEERFNRIKHGKKPRPDNPNELPLRAMRYCLDAAGIDLPQVDHCGYSSNPNRFMKYRYFAEFAYMGEFVANIRRVPKRLRDMGYSGRFHWLDHHAAHAASAYYLSSFPEAAVLTVDGVGDGNTTASFRGAGSQLRLVQDVPAPHSLGFLWELVSMFLGFDIYDATKIMGLAAYGDPERYAEQFRQLVPVLPGGRFATKSDLLRFWRLNYSIPSGYFKGLQKLFGVKRRSPDQQLTQTYRDIAAALQERTDEVVLHMAQHLHSRVGSDNLCLAGGVALNCLTNRRVFEQGPFARLFVQPAAHDAGTAIGTALYLWRHVLGHESRESMKHAYWGPSFSSSEVEKVLQEYGLRYARSDNVEQQVARLVSQGCVVGFFQGRMEVGPRALGNRSLLADPRNPNMREILNQKVKHREYFRPFAPSVLDEEARAWFQIGKETAAAEFMLIAYPVQERVRERIPAVVHVDGTSRIQTVRREINPRFHKLISEFQRLTGVPVVLNTSFNDSEPIVCAPEDAIETFLKTEIDYLAIGDFILSKADNR